MGLGQQLIYSGLPEGSHVIKLVADNGHGQPVSETVLVTIEPAKEKALRPDAALEAMYTAKDASLASGFPAGFLQQYQAILFFSGCVESGCPVKPSGTGGCGCGSQ